MNFAEKTPFECLTHTHKKPRKKTQEVNLNKHKWEWHWDHCIAMLWIEDCLTKGERKIDGKKRHKYWMKRQKTNET